MEIINRNKKFHQTVNWRFFLRSRLLSIFFISAGVLLIFSQVILPFILIETQSTFKAPIQNSVLGVATGFQEVSFSELETYNNEKQLENINNERDYEIPQTFYLQVPKLKINNGKIHTNSFEMNPEDYLGHYAGTALPGEVGNVFIYGHSVLPAFFNEKNYKTIFSTLHTIESGDEIIVRFNGKRYIYEVFEKEIKSPDKVDPLEVVKEGSQTITLMTCTPPGTTFKRLLVHAVLKEVD
jgi:sortase A